MRQWEPVGHADGSRGHVCPELIAGKARWMPKLLELEGPRNANVWQRLPGTCPAHHLCHPAQPGAAGSAEQHLVVET